MSVDRTVIALARFRRSVKGSLVIPLDHRHHHHVRVRFHFAAVSRYRFHLPGPVSCSKTEKERSDPAVKAVELAVTDAVVPISHRYFDQHVHVIRLPFVMNYVELDFHRRLLVSDTARTFVMVSFGTVRIQVLRHRRRFLDVIHVFHAAVLERLYVRIIATSNEQSYWCCRDSLELKDNPYLDHFLDQ